MSERLPEVPEPDSQDQARKIILGVLGFVPGASTVADLILASPHQQRLIDFLKVFAVEFERLCKQVDAIDPKRLAQSEEFMTTLYIVLRMVPYTHRQEKHKILRNVLLNSALPTAPEDDERTVFLNLVEEFSVAHMQTLLLFERFDAPRGLMLSLSDPEWRINALALGELYNCWELHFKKGRPQFHFFVSIVSYLSSRELVSNSHSDESNPTLPLRNSNWPELTNFGSRFLRFIESPLEDEAS
ncbi:MAG: hypothetical protein OXF32_13415 [Anaerolineaceae bacterium]|nr:hypothetical protein [Anaerolineaceae bacterium]